MLQNNPGIKSLIDKLWDRFWSGGIANPMTAIEQITYLLFMKRIDDLDLKRTRDAQFTGEPYASIFKGVFKLPHSDEKIKKETLRWSHFRRMSADEMLLHVQVWVFPFLKELNGAASSFTKHMKNAVFIIPKPSLLVEAIGIIEDIFLEIEKDSQEGGQTFQDIQGDRRQERAVPHAAPHHQADLRAGRPAARPQDSRPGLRHGRVSPGRISIHGDPDR
jgi:type I restriction enzyme M protein